MRGIKFPTGSIVKVGRKTAEVGIMLDDPNEGLVAHLLSRDGRSVWTKVENLRRYGRKY